MLLLQLLGCILKSIKSMHGLFSRPCVIVNHQFPQSICQSLSQTTQHLKDASVISGHRNRTIYRVGKFYIKRYQPISFYQWIRGFHTTPIAQEWRNLQLAESFGLKPVAWIVTGIDAGNRPYLISLALDSSVPINEFIQTANKDSLLLVTGHLGRLLGKMVRARLIHGDLTAKHIFVHRLTYSINLLDWQRVHRTVPFHLFLARLIASLRIDSRHRSCIYYFFSVFCAYAGISRSQRHLLRRKIIHAYRQYRNEPSSVEQQLISAPDQRLIHFQDGMQSVRLTHISLVKSQFCLPHNGRRNLSECITSLNSLSGSLQDSFGFSCSTNRRYSMIPGRCFRLERLNIPTRLIIFFGCIKRFFSRNWFVVSLDPVPLDPVMTFSPRLCDLINSLHRAGFRTDSINIFRHAPLSQQHIVYAVERLKRL